MRPSRPIRRLRPTLARQAGLSIISALFMLLLMAALGALMLTFSTVQHVTQAQDIQGSRAYWAANSGLQWGAYRVVTDNACASTTLTLSGFTVDVACALSGPYDEGGSAVNVYRLTSTASQGTLGSAGYVERQLQATIGE
jgi:MSHA biogenesis protein MshP